MTTTAIAPTNIAILKYWGKNPEWEQLLIPTKSSISFTADGLFTKTTVESSPASGPRTIDFTLNGRAMDPSTKEHQYVEEFLGKVGSFFPFVEGRSFRIVSENNFPTSAGFASSASGFAALVKALSGELDGFSAIRDDDAKLSAIARLGSGSAARSMPSAGGVVLWKRGLPFRKTAVDRTKAVRAPGNAAKKKAMFSSCAESLFGPGHWPGLSIMYVKVEAGEKKVKSRAGMKASIDTNPLYRPWVDYEEDVLLGRMVAAIGKRDFPALGEMIMKASNNLHQICLGTYPPIVYLNQTSLAIIDAVHDMNRGRVKAAYTFDAGPNAVVFAEEGDREEVADVMRKACGPQSLIMSRPGPGARFSTEHLR